MTRFGGLPASRSGKPSPDWVVRQAAEIVAVDVTPDALLNRLKRGAIYKPEMVQKALDGFFKGSNLGALRELTLRQAAHEVDLRQSAYDESSGSSSSADFRGASRWDSGQSIEGTHSHSHHCGPCHRHHHPSWSPRGRLSPCRLHGAVCAHGLPRCRNCRRGARGRRKTSSVRSGPADRNAVPGGSDVAKTVVEFARRHQVTQIFVAHSQTRLGENGCAAGISRRALSGWPWIFKSRSSPTAVSRLRFLVALHGVLANPGRSTPAWPVILAADSFPSVSFSRMCLITTVILSYRSTLALGPVLERLLFGR